MLDSIKMEIRLPEEKARDLAAALEHWAERQSCRKRELLSLIGKLSHACKVIRVGRLFLRRMINIAARAKHIDHWAHLNAEFRADVGWWRAFLPVWNNCCMMLVVDKEALPDFTVYSDVSVSVAIWGNRWLQWEMEGTWADHQIAIKELIPIVVTCAVWDHQWQNK